MREKELMERSLQELKAELHGQDGSHVTFVAPKRRGRRPKHLQYHELHIA
jgi:hypothetical protein